MSAWVRRFCFVALCTAFLQLQDHEDPPIPQVLGIGDATAVEAAYARWKSNRESAGLATSLALPLTRVKGLSERRSEAQGTVMIDLDDGRVRARVSGLAEAEVLQLWLVDNQPGPGRSVKPEPGDRLISLGSLVARSGSASLDVRLDADELAGFEIDLVAASRPGDHPGDSGLLFGAPSLFQKLHWRGEPGGGDDAAPSALVLAFRALVPEAQAAAGGVSGRIPMQGLVDQGERLFFDETFAGNGRTCGTCHPAQNNFTIDPVFISSLDDDDPLFVAEHHDALAEGFEVPEMMRQFGLILENTDGFDPQDRGKFVLRGVPHTLALGTSMGVADPTVFPSQALGWSADGAPGGGSLREFAIGAVVQHFPKTMDRTPGVDFRLPTDHELDALEAFQLSLGRQSTPRLGTLALQNAAAAAGQALFNGTAFCNFCHQDAGANPLFAPTVNQNFDTNAEDLILPHERMGGDPPRMLRPVDGGFGTTPGDAATGFGDGKFNTPTLVEAADTAPFFHNNAAETLEDAIAFYADPLFNSVSPVQINLTQLEIEQIGAFLRVLNAVENIRSATYLAAKARHGGSFHSAARLLLLAAAETVDALQVLSRAPESSGLAGSATVGHLMGAANLLVDASEASLAGERIFLIGEAQSELEAARASLVLDVELTSAAGDAAQ